MIDLVIFTHNKQKNKKWHREYQLLANERIAES